MREIHESSWWIYKGTGVPHNDGIKNLPDPPNWRKFHGEIISKAEQKPTIDDADSERHIGHRMKHTEGQRELEESEIREIEMVNAALYLRRPLLVTGKPGCGKSSLAYMVARELQLGKVLHWPITTRSALADGLYQYDAIGRLQDASYERSLSKDPAATASTTNIAKYLRLGPLGTALVPRKHPRVLLIDEIDKSDIDLPNDLLHIFEEGYFDIPELKRMVKEQENLHVDVMPYDGKDDSAKVPITNGHVECHAFPFVVLTSNGERDFPPAFLRRCLRLDMQLPSQKRLVEIIDAQFQSNEASLEQVKQLIEDFLARRENGDLATDQLLNALYMTSNRVPLQDKHNLFESLMQYLETI